MQLGELFHDVLFDFNVKSRRADVPTGIRKAEVTDAVMGFMFCSMKR